MNLNDYGFTNDYISELDEQTITAGWIPARVTAVHRERYQLVCEHGETYGSFNDNPDADVAMIAHKLASLQNPLVEQAVISIKREFNAL